jgi:hypothetical protein
MKLDKGGLSITADRGTEAFINMFLKRKEQINKTQ